MKIAVMFSILLLSSLSFAQTGESQINRAEKEKKDTRSFVTQNTQTTSVTKSEIELNDTLQTTYVRPNFKQRFNRYVKSVVGPVSLGKHLFGAGYSTWTNSPEEWGSDWEGFGRRFASRIGKSAIKNTTSYALEEAFKLDSRFYRSKKKDFGSRLRNALISPVTARDENGKRVFGFPRIVGTYTSNIIAAETWYPKRYDYKNGLKSGTISLGTTAAFNLVKEFIFKKKE